MSGIIRTLWIFVYIITASCETLPEAPLERQSVLDSVVRVYDFGFGGGRGSGVVVGHVNDTGSYILTANHVVDRSDEARIETHGFDFAHAEVVWRNEIADIALLQTDMLLPPVKVNRRHLTRGMTVTVVGHPRGYD